MQYTHLPPSVFPAYLISGKFYSRLTAEGEGCQWRYIFEHLNTNEEMAPFMYEMCVLTVDYWNL